MLLVVRNLLLQLLKLLLLFLTNVEVLVGLLAFVEGIPIASRYVRVNTRYRRATHGDASGGWGRYQPLRGTPRPGCPSGSFGHSAGGGVDGSACRVQRAPKGWSNGLDNRLTEHDACRMVKYCNVGPYSTGFTYFGWRGRCRQQPRKAR